MNIKVFLNFIRIRSFAPLLVLAFTGAFAGAGLSSFSLPVLLALISIAIACAGAISLNSINDLEIDRIVHKERPLPAGELTRSQGVAIVLICLVLALVIAAFVNLPFFIMMILGYGICLLYEKVTKDQGFIGNVLVALLSGVAVCGGFAVNNPVPALIISLLVFPQTLGGEILRDVRDIAGDRLQRCILPIQIGERNATYIGCFFLGTTFIFIPVALLLHTFNEWYLPGMVLTSILLLLGIGYSVSDFKNVKKTLTITRIALLLTLMTCIIASI
jgi:4-hydroxybenzoate polyprenyltransferase